MNLMLNKFRHSLTVASVMILTAFAAFGQNVYTRPSVVPQPIPNVSPSPLVRQTSKVDVRIPVITPASLEPVVGGTRGILVESPDGKTVVMDVLSNTTFNPASNVKLITALAAMKTLKPNYRFPTKIYTDGGLNKQTATLEGNLYVIGTDPSLNFEHAVVIANALNQMGIRHVNGDVIFSYNFTLSYTPSAQRSGVMFLNSMDADKRTTAVNRAWQNYLAQSKQTTMTSPSVSVSGNALVEDLPSKLNLLVTHESSPVRDILKACLSYSNNFLAERLSDAVGGYESVERIAQQSTGSQFAEIQLASGSGLGMNRVTPRAMMRIFRELHNELAKYKMSPTDIMPVAGIDEGTLKNRFTDFRGRGSVIGKTGTLPNTDSGVSSLVGQMGTAKGEILFFVIFNQGGNVNSFRSYQNNLVTYLQNQRGGAAGFQYLPMSFSGLMAKNKVSITN